MNLNGRSCAAAVCVAVALSAAWNGEISSRTRAEDREPLATDNRVSVDVARDRAQLMHRIYSATLHVMHDHYFHGARDVVPARALEDVFSQMDKECNVQTRWISVNTKAMSIGHEPESDFEKQAAKEIAAGKSEYEVVEGGYYRRAGAIPLAQGCVGCHTSFLGKPDKTPRFAGLVVNIPISSK
jgi:hypothetical protein